MLHGLPRYSVDKRQDELKGLTASKSEHRRYASRGCSLGSLTYNEAIVIRSVGTQGEIPC
jgi:hypothetical protein